MNGTRIDGWDHAREIAYLVLRLALGAIFIAHGSQKLLGLFGGHGLEATIAGMAKGGIPVPFAYLAVIAEFFGGLGVFFGVLARTAAFGIFVTMMVAMLKVHLAGGFFLPKGFEYTLALAAMALFIMLSGPGRWAPLGDLERRLLRPKAEA